MATSRHIERPRVGARAGDDAPGRAEWGEDSSAAPGAGQGTRREGAETGPRPQPKTRDSSLWLTLAFAVLGGGVMLAYCSSMMQ